MSWPFRLALLALSFTTLVWAGGSVSLNQVTLWLNLPEGFSPLTLQRLECELKSIVEPAGLDLGWRRLPNRAGAVVEGASIVVRFRGVCSPESTFRTPMPAAGWAHASEGTILPFIEIDCGQVWSVIEPELESKPRFQREFFLGRALGRVVAHELRHILANTAAHGSEPLTKARLDSRDLITGNHWLTQRDLRARVQITNSSPQSPPPGGPSPSSGANRASGR